MCVYVCVYACMCVIQHPHAYYPQEQEENTAAVTVALATEVEAHCKCGFTVDIISLLLFRCFPQSTNTVTLRAKLIDSTLLSAVQDWVQDSGLLPIQNILIEVDKSCELTVSSFADTECIGEPTTTTPDPTVTSIAVVNDDSMAVIWRVVVGIVVCLLIIAFAITAIVIVILLFKCKNKNLGIMNR